LYSHKVVVDSIIQTKIYTYLKVVEKVGDRDSTQWLALPLINSKAGDVFYFENGLPMGIFQSKELKRTFKQILFLSYVSTSAEVSDKTVLPLPIFDTIKNDEPPAIMHTVMVKEVLQTSGYTYLRVLEDKKEEWLAVVKIQAKAGQTFHYDDAAPMSNFTSKELNRTFPEILFLAKLDPGPAPVKVETIPYSGAQDLSKKNKKGKKLAPAQEVNTIAELLENKKKYDQKLILLKGEVTKYSSGIMGHNWLHIKDGSAYLGKDDIVITTEQDFKIGDKATFEGLISIDKDFGSGYFFEVIMENASRKENNSGN
jgi:hypothetical protein